MATRQRNESNAIAACSFQLVFARAFDPVEMRSFSRLQQSLGDLLPGFLPDTFPTPNFQFGGINMGFGAALGVTMQRINPAGQPQRILRIEGQALNVVWNDYTRWSEVWPQVQRIFNEVLASMNPGNFVVASQLHIVDQFDFIAATEYDAFELYRPGNQYLPAHVSASGTFWHVNQGWWVPDSIDVQGRPAVLNQLNISNIQEGTSQLPGREYSQIEHIQAARSINFPISMAEFNPRVTGMFENMRIANQELLRVLLTDAKLEAMGLQ